MLRRTLKLKTFLIVTIAGTIIVIGLLVGAVRVIDLVAPEYREDVAALVSERIDQPVEVGALDLGWDLRGPVLHLDQAAILPASGGEPVITLDQFALHFDFWHLVRAQFEPYGITLRGPKLALYRDDDGSLRLRGVQPSDSNAGWQEAADRLARLEFVKISDAQLQYSPSLLSEQGITVQDLAVSLTNQGRHHNIAMQALLPPALGGGVKAETLLIGALSELDQFQAHSYVDAKGLDLTALANASGLINMNAPTGKNDIEIWADWRAGQFHNARISLTGRPAGDAARLLPAGTGLDLGVTPDGQEYRVSVNGLRRPQGYEARMDGNIMINPQARTVNAQLQDLPASLLGSWLPWIHTGQGASATGWQTDGLIENARIDVDAATEPAKVSGAISFSNFSLSNATQGLQINGFGGNLSFSPDSGAIDLRAADGALTWTGNLRGSLPIDTLEGRIDWQTQNDGLQIKADNLRWLGADASLTGNGSLMLPAEGTPVAALDAELQVQNAPRLLAYIPQDPELANPRLREWLPEAIKAGRVTRGTVKLEGPLDRFPYPQGGGLFQVEAEIENATLDYKPGWPPVTQGFATLSIDADTLDIQATRGKILGVNIGPTTARVLDLEDPIVAIDGEVNGGDAGRMLSFLANSPLKDEFGQLASVLDVSGAADLQLELSIPLKEELGEVAANGRIDLKNVVLAHQVLPDPIREITGTLTFALDGLRAKGLRGSLLGMPLVADLSPAGDALSIDASTLLRFPRDRQALESFVPAAVVRQLGGEAVWHATLEVGLDGKVSDLALRSDLDGLSLAFPPPLDKAASGPLPVRIEAGANRERIHIDLADRLDMIIRSKNGELESIGMIFGDTGVRAPVGKGIWLGGTIPELDVLAWKNFAASMQAGGSSSNKPALAFRGADLRIQQSHFGGQRMERVQVSVNAMPGSGWEAAISGDGNQGKLRYLPPPKIAGARGLLEGRFTQITLLPDSPRDIEKEDTGNPGDTTPQDPRKLPVTDLVIERIALDGLNIGRLDLQARAVAAGLVLDKLDITGGKLQIQAQGDWVRENGLTSGSLNTQIEGAGLDSLLRTLGFAPNIRAEKTDIRANLNISPNRNGLSTSELNGKLGIDFDDGTLVSIDPGAGRVLGLFNFYALPRRLLFDFRDVIDEGLAFDKINGNFKINAGVAQTDDLKIKMPSATVNIKGQVDLGRRTYDQRVTIVPKVSSGVAVAGTVLGGPAVGAALLLAQKLLEKPIESLSTIKYRLTGDWQDPKIDTVTTEQADTEATE